MTALKTTTTDMEEIEPTEWDYQSGLEATTAERRQMSNEAAWEVDEDWQAFRVLCYPDPGPPGSYHGGASQETTPQGLAGVPTPVWSGLQHRTRRSTAVMRRRNAAWRQYCMLVMGQSG